MLLGIVGARPMAIEATTIELFDLESQADFAGSCSSCGTFNLGTAPEAHDMESQAKG